MGEEVGEAEIVRRKAEEGGEGKTETEREKKKRR